MQCNHTYDPRLLKVLPCALANSYNLWLCFYSYTIDHEWYLSNIIEFILFFGVKKSFVSQTCIIKQSNCSLYCAIYCCFFHCTFRRTLCSVSPVESILFSFTSQLANYQEVAWALHLAHNMHRDQKNRTKYSRGSIVAGHYDNAPWSANWVLLHFLK